MKSHDACLLKVGYANEAEEQCERYGVPFDPVLEGLVEDAEDSTRPARTPDEDAEWEADKRAEYEADRCCGHHWSAW